MAKRNWRTFFINAVISIVSHIAVMLLLGTVGVVGFMVYLSGPFSVYFLCVMLIFVALGQVSRSAEKRLSERADSTATSLLFTATFLKACAGVARVLCLSALPVLLFQIITLGIERDLRETTWRIEAWMFDLNLWADDMDLSRYLTYALVSALVVGLFAFYKRAIAVGVSVSVKTITFVKGMLFFVGFSFFTTAGISEYESIWRAERRADIEADERRLAYRLNKAVIYNCLLVSPEVQQEVVRVISTVITLAASHELMRGKTNAIITATIQNLVIRTNYSDDVEPSLADTIGESVYGDSPPRNHRDVRAYAEAVDDAWRQESASREKGKSLRALLTQAVQEAVPDVPSDVLNDAVNGALEGLASAKHEWFKGSSTKIRALTLAAYLATAEVDPEVYRFGEQSREIFVEMFAEVDREYVERIEAFVLDRHLNPPKIEINWKQRFRKWGNGAARAIQRTL